MLKNLLNPGSIAVIGASEDQAKFGGRLLKNLLRHGYAGTIYPINPTKNELFGLKAYSSLGATPTVADAFVVALPAHKIKEQVETAAKIGIKLGIIISAGFSDAGESGRISEAEIVEIARRHGMRLMGPNCLGIVNAQSKIVLCSSEVMDRDTLPVRPIGFVSQSGALMTTSFDRAWSDGGGFTYGFSVGNQADLELCDFVDFLIDDEATTVICTYIEGLKDPKRWLASARKARQAGKPIVVVKAGRSAAGRQAAFSHTASVTGDNAVFTAVCREEGVLVVDDINTMLTVANVLATQPRRPLNTIAIMTPSGGGGALAADALSDTDLKLASFSEQTQSSLAGLYPSGQADNPIDFGTRLGSDPLQTAQKTLQALHSDPNIDGILFVVTMAPRGWLLSLVDAQAELNGGQNKPVIFAFDAGTTVDPVRERLAELGIPYANTTSEAVKALGYVHKFATGVADMQQASRPIECDSSVLKGLEGQLDEQQTKKILSQYGIRVNAGACAANIDEAVKIARNVGFPVVMKIVSPDIIHKSDVGGVIVRLADEADVRAAHATMLANVADKAPRARIEGVFVQSMVEGGLELILGARNDAQFGPIIVYGAGGILVELLPDKVIARCPLSITDAIRGLQSLSIWPILSGYRGRALAVDALVDAIVRLSWLALDLGDRTFEIDINPLIAGASAAVAVDGRMQIAL